VEFAFTVVPLLLVVFVLFELSSAVYAYTVLSDAANEGVRYAIVHSSDAGLAANTQNKVTSYAGLSLHDMTGMTVTVNTPDGLTPPGRVQVTVSYPYVPYVSFMTSPPTMHAYAEGRMVY
jgi:Flp pilus assembly protein TadG